MRGIAGAPRLLGDDEQAMVELGIGKKYVRAGRSWIQAADLAVYSKQNRPVVTPVRESLLGDVGLDPDLENIRTLWLIHWKRSCQREEPQFACHHLLKQWHQPGFTRTGVLPAFRREAACGWPPARALATAQQWLRFE